LKLRIEIDLPDRHFLPEIGFQRATSSEFSQDRLPYGRGSQRTGRQSIDNKESVGSTFQAKYRAETRPVLSVFD
jgi:hypothetical protein